MNYVFLCTGILIGVFASALVLVVLGANRTGNLSPRIKKWVIGKE